MGNDKSYRGSVWNKWDFHVHTPFSFTHSFDGNFSNEDSENFQDGFDEYVKQLFNRAIASNISAIGITDYFRIDGYKKLRTEYLDNSSKLMTLFGSEEIVSKINNIFVFPNIEMRLNNFVGRNCENIDFHVLFSPSIPIGKIEDNFINALKFTFEVSSGTHVDKRAITASNIRDYGEKLQREQGFSGDPLKIGFEHIALNLEDIVNVLQSNTDFKHNYLTVVDDDNLAKIPWTGRDHGIRKEIIKCSDLQFSNNASNIEWGLGLKGSDQQSREEKQKQFISEFGKLIPSITGSDAHSYETMFAPQNNLFCWIKSNIDFEGLRQIIFEPECRVKIQATKPEEKNSDKVIDRIEFDDPKFSKTAIYFNDNLNCIIGGKSTGKSLLLREIAKTIDNAQVDEREEEANLKRKKELLIKNARVFWKDGSEDHSKRKIIYIPQTYLNRLTDEEQETTQIDELIENVLFQNENIFNAHRQMKQNLADQKEAINKNILDYTTIYQKYSQLEEQLKENGTSETVEKGILKLKEKIDTIAKKLKVSNNDIKQYNIALAELDDINSKNKNILSDQEILLNLNITTDIKRSTELTQLQFKDQFVKNQFSQFSKSIMEYLEKEWNSFHVNIAKSLDDVLQGNKSKSLELRERIAKIQPIIESVEEIKELTKRVGIEEQRKKRALDIESELVITGKRKQSLYASVLDIFKKYKDFYDKYVLIIKQETQKVPTKDMNFSARVVFRKDSFIEKVLQLYNQKTLTSQKDKMLKSDPESISEEEFYYNIPKTLLDETIDGEIRITKNYTLENIFRELLSDWYNIDYTVNMGTDDIRNMSPGKKSLVLLRLLLELAQSDSPILIDQPEDDLDNRSIYDDIVKYIKSKKRERQIIIVTHNANIVLGSDSEEVIIANQDGEDCQNNSSRFEYRIGAIEDNTKILNSDGTQKKGILNSSGIRDQICTILEGGSDAFSLRENRYSLI